MDQLITNYELIVGVFLPLLIAFFVREEWSKKKKTAVSFGFVFLAAIGHVFYSGALDFADLGRSILAILVLTVTIYKGFWNFTGATDAIEKNLGLVNKTNT
jgi:VIT1/CCC1 family predicted Fe2+/Mn2+ transporter